MSTQGKHLYTYLPKSANVEKEGIRSIATLNGDEWKKYSERAGSDKKEDVVKWLESTFPGRTRAFSCFTQPIPDDAHSDILRFRDAKQLVILPSYEELLKAGVVEACWATNIGKRGCTKVDGPNYNDSISWVPHNKKLLFTHIPHYIIVIKNGIIPPKYCKVVKQEQSHEALQPRIWTMNDIKSIDDLKAFYKVCRYALVDWKEDKCWKDTHKNTELEDWEREWRLLTPEQVVKYRCGVCWDTAMMSHYFLNKWNIEHQFLFSDTKRAVQTPHSNKYNDDPTHTYVIYKDQGKWKWLEGSWGPFKSNNWSENNPDTLIKNVTKALANSLGVTYLTTRVISFPRFGVTMKEFYSFMEKFINHAQFEVQPDSSYSKEEMVIENDNLLGDWDKEAEWTISSFKSVSDLKEFYKIVNNEPYLGRQYVSPGNDPMDHYTLGTYKSVIAHKQGICYDTASTSDHFLSEFGIDHKLVFMYNRLDASHINKAHLTCIYKEDYKWKWLEGSWKEYQDNEMEEDNPDVLASKIGKIFAEQYGYPVYGGYIEKMPSDGTMLQDLRSSLISQSEKNTPFELSHEEDSEETFIEAYATITFPKEEIPTLRKQDRIITTRVSNDYNKFHKGDIVKTPWDKLYKITDRIEITNVKDHPYYKELTEDQIKLLSKYDKIAVLTLVIQKDSNEEMIHKWVADDISIYKATGITDEQWNFLTTTVNLAAKASNDESWTVEEVKNKVKNNNLEVYFFLQKKFVPGDDRSFTNVYHPMGALLFNPKNMFISNFAIIEKAQGQGVGFLSLKKFVLMMRSEHPTKDINVNVAACNTAAKSLYKKLGFVEVSTLYGACRMTLKKDKELEESTEVLAEKVIKDGFLYHGSGGKYSVLKPQTQLDVNYKKALSLSPYKSIASMFIIPFGQLGKGYRRCYFRVEEWFHSSGLKYEPLKVVHVYHNIKGFDFEKVYNGYLYTIKAEDALKDAADNPRWTDKREVLSYVPELHPVKTEQIQVRVIVKYDREKVKCDFDAIPDDGKERIGQVVYHGSPDKLSVLKGSATVSGKKGHVYVSPYKAVAALYCINQSEILEAVGKQLGKRIVKSNFTYELWTKKPGSTELYQIPKRVKIGLNIRGFKPVHGKASGYLYMIDAKKYNLDLSNSNDKEAVIEGDVHYIKVEPISLEWVCEPSEDNIKQHGEGQLGTSEEELEYSPESIDVASKYIKNNTVYHGSPQLLSKLCGRMTLAYTQSTGSVYVSPFKSFAAIFACNHRVMIQQLRSKFHLPDGTRYFVCLNKSDYSSFKAGNPVGKLQLKVVTDKKFEPGSFENKGYVYHIDFSKYSKNAHNDARFNGQDESPYEFLVKGDITPSSNEVVNCTYYVSQWSDSDANECLRLIQGFVSDNIKFTVSVGFKVLLNFVSDKIKQLGKKMWSKVKKAISREEYCSEDIELDPLENDIQLEDSSEALTRSITNYLNIGNHSEIKSTHPDWEKEAAFKVTEFLQNNKVEKSTVLKQILSRIKLPSDELTDTTSVIEVSQYDRSQLGPIARSIYEFYIKYMVRCNVFTQKLAQLYFDEHANEEWAHDVRIKQIAEKYDQNLLSEEQIINYAPYIVKEYGPVELKSSFDLLTDNYVNSYLSKLESDRRSSMLSYPDYWDPSSMPDFALVFYLAELTVMHHTSDLYNSALISYNVQDEQSEKALDMYGVIRELATHPKDVSNEALQGKEELPDSVKKKIGEYLYHGTHRDLNIKHLAVHFCKNRANTEIKAPVVYMERTLGLASLHCAEYMKGHSSKKTDYKEHFVELDKAINSDEVFKHVEIVHNDPDLEEASGENDGFIYCTKKENCIDKLYFSTPKEKNDYLFVSYSPLPVDKKIKIHISWHRKYDENFAKSVKSEKYAGVESLEYIPTLTDAASIEDDCIMDAGKYYIVRGFPVYPFFHRLKRHYNSTKLENILSIVRSIGIASFFTTSRTVKIHKFFIPEIIYLLNKFNMAPNIIEHLQKDTWLGEKSTTHTNCDINRVYSNMNCTLYPHQDKFIREYAEHKDSHKLRGYLLSFSQGLGKTITSVALMEALAKDRVVVICPKNTMVETWKSHFQRFYKKEQSIYVSGVDKEFTGQRFCIFNYDAIDKMNSLSGVKTPNMGVIVDESHNFLRMQSSRTRKLIDLAKFSDKSDMLLMSGTPIKACGIEMIPMLAILDPIFDEEAASIFKLSFGYNVKIATDVLNARLHCIMERVTKDVLDLPPKTRTTIKITLPEGHKYTIKEVRKGMEKYIQERLKFHRDHMVEYRQEFDECMNYLNTKSDIANDEEFKRYKTILNKLIHNRGQFTQGDLEIAWMNKYEKDVVEKQLPPELLQKFRHSKAAIKYLHLKVRGEVLGQYLGKLRIEMTSAMLKKANLKQMIDEAHKKTIIFTSFVDTIETCEKYVRSMGYKPIVIYGKNSGEIAPLAKQFQTDMTYNPLIASLQTLSTGATLTAANRVIFLNKPWRSVDYEQASDRVHRIGQDSPVDIISLVLDTGDQGNLSTRMEDIMDASAAAFDAIVEEQKKKEDKKSKASKESFYLPLDVLEECRYGESYMNCVDIEPIDTSIEGMTLLHDTHEQRVLNRMAKPHYREKGANSWEHVQQDIANAILLVGKVLHRKLTLQEYATILYHDCGCKSMYPEKEGHGLRGVEIAKPELKKCGFFSNQEIEDICVAILEHDETTNPKNLHSSDLSDLLASADTNPPDIPWILNKSYVWGLRHGETNHKKNIENVVKYMSKIYGSEGEMIYPKLYKEYYKDEIKAMNKFFDTLTVEKCEKIVGKYREEHELKYNELSLPEPNTDQKITFSEEGMTAQYAKMQFANNPNKKRIWDLSKKYYDAVGCHGVNHIQEVLATAYVLKGKKDLTDVEYAAIVYHDVGRPEETETKHHNVISVEIAKKELPKLNIFTKEQLEEIYKAILNHSHSWRKAQNIKCEQLSGLSELLAYADRGFPQTSYYEICLRPTLWILEGNDKSDNPAKWERLHHYKTIDDIAQGVLETLDDIKGKRHDSSEDSIYTRAFVKERALQDKLRNEISLDVIKPAVVKIMKDYKYKQAVGAEMYSNESLEPSMESADIKAKRKKIQDFILKSMKLLDPHTTVNVDYWKKKFDSMSDKDFDRFMHNLREKSENIHMYVPPFKVTLRNQELINAAHELGVKLMHRIWMRDAHTGIKYLTPEEYMVVQLPVRRQQQFLDEKLSVPDNDKTIDGLTGQVAGDSKACAITNPEIQIFHARNLDSTLFELANVRGGNIGNYAEFKRSLEETGEVSLNQLDPMNRTRVSVVGQVLMTAMHLDINLVDI